MPVHVAIPEPTSSDTAYNQRSLPAYLSSLQSVGATPVLVPLHERPDRVARLLRGVQGVLLPGSGFDVDPRRYGEEPIAECGASDAERARVDEQLLRDAFDQRKPVLGICHGAQMLNVWLNGSLVQNLRTSVNHMPGRAIAEAHVVEIAEGSRLAGLLPKGEVGEVAVNSSHHQAIRVAAHPLRVTAVCPVDGVIEAVELESEDHFVVGVQWHPERTYTQSELSRRLFAAFMQAAAAWAPGKLAGSTGAA